MRSVLPLWADVLILSGLPLILGIVLWRWGASEPDNVITHESGEDAGDGEDDPGGLLVAA